MWFFESGDKQVGPGVDTYDTRNHQGHPKSQSVPNLAGVPVVCRVYFNDFLNLGLYNQKISRRNFESLFENDEEI